MAPLLSLVKQVEEPNATGKKDEGRQATEPHAPVQSTGMGLDNLTVANTLQFVATFDPSENRKWEGQENEDSWNHVFFLSNQKGLLVRNH